MRQMGLAPPPETRIVVVNPDRHTPYSGMLPGFVSGHYAFGDCHIDLDRLCHGARVHFRRAAALAIDPQRNTVALDDGASLPYDVLSINIGSTPPVDGVPGALEHATRVKPVSGFLRVWDKILDEAARAGRAPRIAVVGGGAGGVELALALHYKLARCCPSAPARVCVLTDTATILSGHARRVGGIVGRVLAERGIAVHAHSKVVRIEPGRLHTGNGAVVAADHFIWATGAGAPSWIAESGIHTDGNGFIAVNAFLQSISHPGIFAAGDIASVAGHRIPKSGVYAVRQGPPLATNLRRALGSAPFVSYVPQRTTLALVSTGNKYAVASYGRIAFEGAWVWHWKDRIDRRFMRQYHAASRINSGGDTRT
jgi:selenide,water dikinase